MNSESVQQESHSASERRNVCSKPHPLILHRAGPSHLHRCLSTRTEPAEAARGRALLFSAAFFFRPGFVESSVLVQKLTAERLLSRPQRSAWRPCRGAQNIRTELTNHLLQPSSTAEDSRFLDLTELNQEFCSLSIKLKFS